MSTNDFDRRVEGARKGAYSTEQTAIQDLLKRVRQLERKNGELEKKLDQLPWLVRFLNLLNWFKFWQPRNGMITMEMRLKEGAQRFIEFQNYDDKRRIYENYSEYYEDVSNRMMLDKGYT